MVGAGRVTQPACLRQKRKLQGHKLAVCWNEPNLRGHVKVQMQVGVQVHGRADAHTQVRAGARAN